MASSSVYTNKSLKGLDSRKSNSWWWDSHIGQRSSKWLAENLEDMDQNYKRMLKLIEGDGDSFAKKAEMYYQRRPELLSHVEEFYQTYKSLAERYEHLTGDMRKHLQPELQSQGSAGFDSGSETTSVSPQQYPKISRRGLGHRAAGFDFFLGYGKSGLDRSVKGDETSSISDSETESDVSSLHSYPGMTVNAGEERLQMRSTELDVEACSEEKFQSQDQDYRIGSFRRINSENFDDVHSKIAGYEEELKMAKEKIHQSEEEIADLKAELEKCKSLESLGNSAEINAEKVLALHDSSNAIGLDGSGPEEKIQALIKQLGSTNRKLEALDKEAVKLRKDNRESTESIRKMQDLLKMAQKDAATWKGKLETEKRLASKLQDRIARYKTSLTDREYEVRELKEVISDANRKYQLHAEISKLTDEKTCLEQTLREWEVHCHSLETQHGLLETKLTDEVDKLKADITEKTGRLEVLDCDLNTYKLKYDCLLTEKDKVDTDVSTKENQIVQMENHLQNTIAENEVTRRKVDELKLRVEELRKEIEGQKALILEAAEEKREAIRQLCYSLEHYRNGYQQLRQAFTGHKQLHVFAS